MNIEIDYSIEFKRKEVFEFIFDTAQNTFQSPLPVIENYTVSGNTLAGKIQEIEEDIEGTVQEMPLKLFGQVKEHYSIFNGRTLVSNFEALIPVEQGIELSILCHLFIKDGTPSADITRIQQVFNQYDVNSGLDPVRYAEQKVIELGLAEDIFTVKNSYEIKKSGQLIEHRDEIDRKLAIINNAQIHLNGFSEGEDRRYFEQLRYRAFRDKRELLYEFEEPVRDELHEGEGLDTSEITNTLKEEVLAEVECQINTANRIEEEIATVLVYPELKQDWEWKMVKIGCIKTKLYLPVTYKRLTKKILYAYIGLPDNIIGYIRDEITSCAKRAALAAAVIGIVFENLPAALYSFKALFVEYVKNSLGKLIDCLFPGLFILTRKTNWSRL